MIETDFYESEVRKEGYSPEMVFVEASPIDLVTNGSSSSDSDEQTHGLLQEDDIVDITASIISGKRKHKSSGSSSSSSSTSSSRSPTPPPPPPPQVTVTTSESGSDCICFCCCHPCFEKQRDDNLISGEALVSLEKALITLSVVDFILSFICSCFYPLFLLFYAVDILVIIIGFIGSIAKKKNLIRIFYGFSALLVLGFIVVMIVVTIFLVKSALKNGGVAVPSWDGIISSKSLKRLSSSSSFLLKKVKANLLINENDNTDDDDDDPSGGDDDDDDDDFSLDDFVDTLVYMSYFLIVIFFVLNIICRIKAIKAAKNAVIAMNEEEDIERKSRNGSAEEDRMGGGGMDKNSIPLEDIGGVPGSSPEFNGGVLTPENSSINGPSSVYVSNHPY